LGRDDESQFHGPAHSDFWRISKDGFAFLLRGYEEDELEDMPPGEILDMQLPILRVAEVLRHAQSLASHIADGPSRVEFLVRFQGLRGRRLGSVTGSRRLAPTTPRSSQQNEIESSILVNAEDILSGHPEMIHKLLEPVYGLFQFFLLTQKHVREALLLLQR
jgi:hypothetical protein